MAVHWNRLGWTKLHGAFEIFTYNDRSSVIARKLQANQPGEKLTSWIDGGAASWWLARLARLWIRVNAGHESLVDRIHPSVGESYRDSSP